MFTNYLGMVILIVTPTIRIRLNVGQATILTMKSMENQQSALTGKEEVLQMMFTKSRFEINICLEIILNSM